MKVNMVPPYCHCVDGEYESLLPDGEVGEEFCASCKYSCKTCADGDTCSACETATPVFRRPQSG